MYEDWGFSQNPFDTNPLPPNDLGAELLIGRQKSLQKLTNRIKAFPKVATIEGLNGVGKTSLANVASFELHKASMENPNGAKFFPCRKVFQIGENTDPANFRKSVLIEVIQTIIDHRKHLPIRPGRTKPDYNAELDRWLNRAEQLSGQVGVPFFQFGGSRSATATQGFEASGFERAAIAWLAKLFPTPADGGVVCVIDNLELLRTSQFAADMLEGMRDEILNIAGLRWVFCGALGIIHGVAMSPRMEGYLHSPVKVRETLAKDSRSVFATRVEAFKARDDYTLPVSEYEFNKLSRLFRGNLRSVLSHLDDYCCEIYDEDWESFQEIPHYHHEDWITEKSLETFKAIDRDTNDSEKRVLARAAAKNQAFRVEQHKEFGQTDEETFDKTLKKLQKIGVLRGTVDENDPTSVVFRVAPKGFLVDHCEQFRKYKESVPSVDLSDGTSDKEWFKDNSWSGN